MHSVLSNKEILSKVSSNCSLMVLFSYLNYNYLLKLVMYNKNLQKKFGINSINYNIENNFNYIKRKITLIHRNFFIDDLNIIILIFSLCCSGCCFLYYIIYPILLNTLYSFDENNLKENYDKKSLETIKLINLVLFPYFLILFITIFIFHKCIFIERTHHVILELVILIIILLIDCAYEGLIIYKLILSYKIKKSGNWYN